MKIPLAAVTFAITGLSATPVNPPAQTFDATSIGRQVIVVPAQDLNPHFAPNGPIPYGSLREASATQFGVRLDRLDDRVSNLKARADLTALRTNVDADFDRLKALRANVATALLNLRNPTIGVDAGETAVTNAINELEIAIDALAQRLERLDTPRVS